MPSDDGRHAWIFKVACECTKIYRRFLPRAIDCERIEPEQVTDQQPLPCGVGYQPLFGSQPLLLKTFADRLCIYHGEKWIATHP